MGPAVQITAKQQLVLDTWDEPFGALPESWQHYILSTLVSSLARTWVRKATEGDWTRARRRAKAILESPTTSIAIGCTPDEGTDAERLIVGYVVHVKHVLHFAFTRPGYRGVGVAQALMRRALPSEAKGAQIPVTHWSRKLPAEGWKVVGDWLLFYCGVDRIRGHNAIPDR